MAHTERTAHRARPGPVVVGGRVPGKVMLKDGLKAGERIVTEGVGNLQVGAKVAEGGAKAAPAEAAAK